MTSKPTKTDSDIPAVRSADQERWENLLRGQTAPETDAMSPSTAPPDAESTLARHWRQAILRELERRAERPVDLAAREARFNDFVRHSEKTRQPAPGQGEASTARAALAHPPGRLTAFWREASNRQRWSMAAALAVATLMLPVLLQRPETPLEEAHYRGESLDVQRLVSPTPEKTLAEIESIVQRYGAKTRRLNLSGQWRLEAKLPENTIAEARATLAPWSITVPANGVLIVEVAASR